MSIEHLERGKKEPCVFFWPMNHTQNTSVGMWRKFVPITPGPFLQNSKNTKSFILFWFMMGINQHWTVQYGFNNSNVNIIFRHWKRHKYFWWQIKSLILSLSLLCVWQQYVEGRSVRTLDRFSLQTIQMTTVHLRNVCGGSQCPRATAWAWAFRFLRWGCLLFWLYSLYLFPVKFCIHFSLPLSFFYFPLVFSFWG